jgi:hypothetical protein
VPGHHYLQYEAEAFAGKQATIIEQLSNDLVHIYLHTGYGCFVQDLACDWYLVECEGQPMYASRARDVRVVQDDADEGGQSRTTSAVSASTGQRGF